jgi:hypothetical protein
MIPKISQHSKFQNPSPMRTLLETTAIESEEENKAFVIILPGKDLRPQ